MLSPSSSTLPSARAAVISSCMRLRQRMNVDLPQPEGPMMAVTPLAWISMSMPCRTSWSENQALRPLTVYLGGGLMTFSGTLDMSARALGVATAPLLHTIAQQNGGGVENQHHQ